MGQRWRDFLIKDNPHKDFPIFGKDPLTGRTGEGGYELEVFRGQATLPITAEEILDREDDMEQAAFSAEEESFRRRIGIKRI